MKQTARKGQPPFQKWHHTDVNSEGGHCSNSSKDVLREGNGLRGREERKKRRKREKKGEEEEALEIQVKVE